MGLVTVWFRTYIFTADAVPMRRVHMLTHLTTFYQLQRHVKALGRGIAGRLNVASFNIGQESVKERTWVRFAVMAGSHC